MHIQTATFTMPLARKAKFQEKLRQDGEAITQSNCLAQEVWLNETKNEVQFTIVSKWASKKDFQQWIGREEHLEAHRRQAQARKDNPQQSATDIQKKLKSYQLYQAET